MVFEFSKATLIHKHITSSTMDDALELSQSTYLPFVVLADAQTQGRGRYQREWISPKGNLYMTLAWQLSELIPLNFLPLIFGLVLVRVMENMGIKAVLKWPNDVLIQGAKVGGILMEKHDDLMLCGIGLNVVSAPENTPYPATFIGSVMVEHPPSTQDLVQAILDQLDQVFTHYTLQGSAWVISEWEQHRWPENSLRLNLPGGVVLKGTYQGLSPEGAITILEQETQKVRTIMTADVFAGCS